MPLQTKPVDRKLPHFFGIEIVHPHVELPTLDIFDKHGVDWGKIGLELIEICGRVSHKSEGRIKKDSAAPFVERIAMKLKHKSILEHWNLTANFIGSRSMSHQLVRHRIGANRTQDDENSLSGIIATLDSFGGVSSPAITQESQRFCDYSEQRHTHEGEDCPLLLVVPQQPFLAVLPTGMKIIYEMPDMPGVAHTIVPDGLMEMSTDLNATDFGNVIDFLRATSRCYRTYLQQISNGVPPEEAREVLPNATKTEVYVTWNMTTWRWFFTMRMDRHAQKQIRFLANAVFQALKERAPLFLEHLYDHSEEKL